MPAKSAFDVTQTSMNNSNEINASAERYWQNFVAARPIEGGMAYEDQLRACQLDESLASLQRLDTLITQIRREHIKADTLDESVLLSDDRYRNLLLFLAFYAGRVLAKQWQSTPQWYDQFALRKHYPKLSLATDDFYQQMAVKYNDTKEPAAAELFFALEPIGLRLFGSVDRKFTALQGGSVASGLYQAVSTRLPNASDLKSEDKIDLPKIYQNQKMIGPKAFETSADNSEIMPAPPKEPLKSKKVNPTPDIFTQLLTELEEIEVLQGAGNDNYRQACNTLDQFERHIARQQKPRAQVVFARPHQEARQRALIQLEQAAGEGHTGAMLRLAMYELLGEGRSTDNVSIDNVVTDSTIDKNKQADETLGATLVKQAANNKDSRAQRLLSKMYYQGIGVSQDIASGRFWLEQAAQNGHDEAVQILAQWQQAERLITTKKDEQHSIKRYQLLIAAIAIGALLLLILV